MDNATNDNVVRYKEFNPVRDDVLELKTKMDIQIPAIQKSVDKIDKRVGWLVGLLITVLLGLVTTSGWVFVKYVLSNLGGSQ